MFSKSILLILFVVGGLYAVNSDKDGCWEPSSSCISATAKWSKYEKNYLQVRYTNNCNARVYLKMCNEINGRKSDCGDSGLSVGRSTTWSTYNANGEYTWNVIGSIKSGNDWVCTGKVSNWGDISK